MPELIALYRKDPAEVLDYHIDWAPVLDDDEIESSTWQVDEGLTVELDTHTETTTTIWLAGGDLGMKYVAENTVETTGGRIHVRSIAIELINR